MVGEDIAEVFAEVGAKVWLERTGESAFIDYEMNVQISNPFIREHMIEGTLPYNTNILPGDILRLDAEEIRYLVVNYVPELFENEIVSISTTLYKCNVHGKIYKEVETTPDQNTPMSQRLSRQVAWEYVGESYVVFTSSLRGGTSEMLGTQDFGDIIVKHNIIYLPSNVEIKPKYRFYIDDDEYYQVGNVEKRRFNNVAVVALTEDTRHNNYIEDPTDVSDVEGES